MLKENSSISMKELFSSFADKEKNGYIKKREELDFFEKILK